jgi:hypothetical protein
MTATKEQEKLDSFCQANKIEIGKIRWKVRGDKGVRVSLDKKDLSQGSWGLLSVAVQFALKEVGLSADITFRESKKSLDIILER